jgi:hypothetical protein
LPSSINLALCLATECALSLSIDFMRPDHKALKTKSASRRALPLNNRVDLPMLASSIYFPEIGGEKNLEAGD